MKLEEYLGHLGRYLSLFDWVEPGYEANLRKQYSPTIDALSDDYAETQIRAGLPLLSDDFVVGIDNRVAALHAVGLATRVKSPACFAHRGTGRVAALSARPDTFLLGFPLDNEPLPTRIDALQAASLVVVVTGVGALRSAGLREQDHADARACLYGNKRRISLRLLS